jgi:hypothetical protein
MIWQHRQQDKAQISRSNHLLSQSRICPEFFDDAQFAARAYSEFDPSATLVDISFQLNQTPGSPLMYGNPQELALRLLTAPATSK